MIHQDFVQILKSYRDIVSPLVKKYVNDSLIFPNYCQIDRKYDVLVEFQKNLISEYPNRLGKYLRPTLLLSTALSMGSKIDAVILSAVAMQLSEEWILIHDDIEDESLERRGLPTLQRMYNPALAINAGDAIQTIMWKVIGDIDNKKIFNEFCLLLNRTTLGQTIDIKWNQDNKIDITDEDVFLILESKTCYYTISGPMRLGAIFAGASEDQLETIYLFGRYLGRAFQIIDDVLDITSDFSGLKKQPYNDIYEGKRTIPLSHLIKQANASELKTIKNILSKHRHQKTEPEVLEIISLMKKYHSIDSARDLAIKFSVDAKKILKDDMSFISVEPYRQQLETAIDFIVNRDH
jgi:geranylgeranyl diphosphate synthase, type II